MAQLVTQVPRIDIFIPLLNSLGMSHDGTGDNNCTGEEYLMSPSTGPGKVSWSKCSNYELKNFLKGYAADCLKTTRGGRSLDTNSDKLPGEHYGTVEQCTFAYGSAFKPYVTSKVPYNNVCRELWCQNTTHALRSHPALDGTNCGTKKFCINGRCEQKPQGHVNKVPRSKTTPTKKKPRRSRGISSLLWRIRNMFKRYTSLRADLPVSVFTSFWHLTNLTPCSADCGGGWQQGEVTCTTSEGSVFLENDMCDPDTRPVSRSVCNTSPCKALHFPSI